MNFGHLFTSFEGRINRKPYWLCGLALLAVMIVVYFLMTGLVAVSTGSGAMIMQIVLVVVIAYPATALMVKRLHDCERPSSFAAILWAPSVLNLLGQLTGASGHYFNTRQGVADFVPNTLGLIILGLSFVIGIWGLIELGFLRHQWAEPVWTRSVVVTGGKSR